MSSNIWITAASAVKNEGNSGVTAFTFTVMRDGDMSGPASVNWAVIGSGADQANATDFGGAYPSGTVSFAAGQTSRTITVSVNGDTTFEPDEAFKVTLSNPSGGAIGVPPAAGTATSFIAIADASATTALAMANKMLGGAPGLAIVSAQFTGDPSAAAMFNAVNLGSAGGSTLALGKGVLLTSGDGTPPASNTAADYSQENVEPGDSALEFYAAAAFPGAGGTGDATILQATFTVATTGGSVPTHVSVDVMFGSDEYPEFSNTFFVDIAAIEIDGVNYAYFNQSPQQPLSVINNNLMVGNFIDNQGNVLAIEYDGISAPLRVVGALNTSLAQHTIRIAIADTGDYSWDSGIFVSNLRAFTGSPGSGGGGILVISQDSAEGTILNDDAAAPPGKVWITVGNAVKHEGHSGPTAFEFTVTRDGDTSGPASVAWAVAGTGAKPANATDFSGGAFPSGAVSFAAGETTKTITVNVNGDTVFEPDETFMVTLSSPVGVALGTGSVSTSLNDSASGGSEIKESYYTLAGGGGDFAMSYEMYSIPDQAEIYVNGVLAATTGGLVSGTGTLTVPGAGLDAGDLVLVRLTGNASSATQWNYTINYAGGVQSIGYLANGTILNDDAQVVGTVGFSGASIYRPLDLMFLHDLSSSFGDDVVTVRALVPDLVTAIRSFQADSRFGVASFVDKPVSPFGGGADYVYRTDLGLTVDQAQLQSVINGLAVLNGNDVPEAQIEALMQLALRTGETGYRPGAVRVAVLMTDAPYHVAGDHATVPANDGDTELEGTPPGTGEDYPGLAQLKAALEAANIVPVFAVTSAVMTSYQGLVASLGRGVVVPLSSNSSDLVNSLTLGLKTIAANVDQDEGNSGVTPFVFTVTRDGDSSVAASVGWAVTGQGGKAVDAGDLAGGVLPSGTVTFGAGETSKTITVSVNGDTTVEPDEGFRITLTNPSSLTLRPDSYFADGTVRNDDAKGGGIWVTAAGAVKYEGHSGPTPFTLTVMRDGDTSGPASVDWAVTGSGTNPANATDFYGGAFPTGKVTFAAGETSKTITVNVNGDTTFEPDEGFKVTLSNPSGGAIGTPGQGGTSGAGVVTNFVPITGTDAATAQAMAAKVLGGASGVTIVSAQYTGSVNAASLFDGVNLGSAGGKTLALGAGVLLTSGDGTPPVSNTQTGYTQNNSVPGDTGLNGYAKTAFSGAGTTNDATVLQATFTVGTAGGSAPTHVSIDLMFGSDEYPEYKDSSYVDIAAIEIDGVNYAYFNQSPQQPLSIINNNLVVGNFIDNQGKVLAIEYDGISAPLRVVGALNTSLAQHTIRIAIADTGDARLDSGIFVSNLRAFTGSPGSGGGGISVISQDSAEGVIRNDDTAPGVVIPGTPGNDTQIGTPGDDDLGGLDGDDIFIPDLGNDTVDGGPGIDTVRLPLFPNQFHFTHTGAGQFSTSYLGFTTTMSSVEYVEFGTQFKTRLPIIDMLSGKIQDNLAKLTDLYLAFFGRAPDVIGLEYWQEQLLELGRSFKDISKDFSWSGEAQALFPSGSSNREFVKTVYMNCFGREPDAAGWDYWTGVLDKLNPNDPNYLNDRGSFVGELLLGAYAPTSGVEDRSLLTNRHELSLYYANQLVLQPGEGFDASIDDLLKMVTGNTATLTKAEHVIDHAFDYPVTLTGVMDNAALLATLWAAG